MAPTKVPEEAEVKLKGMQGVKKGGGGEGRDRKVGPVSSKEEKEVIR